MNTAAALAALLGILNARIRAPPLRILAHIKYPGRELQPHTLPDGAIQFTLKKWGFQYKSKSPRPKNPLPADTAAIQAVFTTALAPQFTVRTVTDAQTQITITLEEIT